MKKKTKTKSVVAEMNPDDMKFKVTIYVDGDVLDAIRDDAKSKKVKYQPHINQLLRSALEAEKGKKSIEERVTAIEQHLKFG